MQKNIGIPINGENFFASSIGQGEFNKNWTVKLILDLPKKSKAVYLQRFSQKRNEHEVLIDKAQHFIPTSVKEVNGKLIVHLRAIV